MAVVSDSEEHALRTPPFILRTTEALKHNQVFQHCQCFKTGCGLHIPYTTSRPSNIGEQLRHALHAFDKFMDDDHA